jgi:hypothetical protein
MDQGRNRTGADILAITGMTNTTLLSGAIRWAHLFSTGRAKSRDTLEPDEAARLFQAHYRGLQDYVQSGRAVYKATGHPASLVVALLYMFHKANNAKAKDYATAWETGERGAKFKAIGLAQAKITALHEASSGRVHDVVRAALMVKAWNIYAAGRRGTKAEMEWDMSHPFPEIGS